MGIGSAIQIGIIAAIVLGVLGFGWMAFRSARKRGQREIQLDQAEQSAGRAQDAAKIDEDVARADIDDVDDELRRN